MLLPPEGPNSGYLVIQDEEPPPTYCLGLCGDNPCIKELPFPQNKRLWIHVETYSSLFDYKIIGNHVYFIPVINKPLSYSRYYAIDANETSNGALYTSSKEQIYGFNVPWIHGVNQRPLFDPNNVYQQFEFSVRNNGLQARSVARDGRIPSFLCKERLRVVSSSTRNFTMEEAWGSDSSLRAHLLDFNFPEYQECSKSKVVGKWYCPFMFITDGQKKDQIKNPLFYELTLKQRWKRIYSRSRSYKQGNNVKVDVVVPTKTIRIEGKHVAQQEPSHDDGGGTVYYKSVDDLRGEKCVGLSSLIVDRMMWEENIVGWNNENRKSVRVVRNEEYGGDGCWLNFGCYLLIETFSLKRNDGSVVLTFEFWHTHQIRNKWV